MKNGMTKFHERFARIVAVMLAAGWGLSNTPHQTARAQTMTRCSEALGSIVSLQGQVEIRAQNQQLWQKASLGEQVCRGDSLRAGAYGRAGLTLLNAGEIIRLDQNTTIYLPDEADGSLQ